MIRISEIEVYHSDTKIGNDYYLRDNEGHREFLENVLGKKERYIKDDGDNTLSYMKKVATKVLQKRGLTGEDIDLVVCATQTPEFFVPPMSAVLHNYLGVKDESAFYDINVSCIGMVFAFDQVYNLMRSDKRINKALIVACDLVRQFVDVRSNNFGNFGDLSCAIILEKDNDPEGSRILETRHFSDTDQKHCMMFPNFKLSKIYEYKDDLDLEYKIMFPDNLSGNFPVTKQRLTDTLKDNHVEPSEIAMMCCTQGSLVGVESVRNHLGLDKDRCLYVGDDYGYNACTSPFVVLYEAIKRKLVKRGDYILFWTYGAGCQHIISLVQY